MNGEPFEVHGHSFEQVEGMMKELDKGKKAAEVAWKASEEALDREMNGD